MWLDLENDADAHPESLSSSSAPLAWCLDFFGLDANGMFIRRYPASRVRSVELGVLRAEQQNLRRIYRGLFNPPDMFERPQTGFSRFIWVVACDIGSASELHTGTGSDYEGR